MIAGPMMDPHPVGQASWGSRDSGLGAGPGYSGALPWRGASERVTSGAGWKLPQLSHRPALDVASVAHGLELKPRSVVVGPLVPV